MKAGKVYPVSWEIHCPECGVPLLCPVNGSYLWTEEDLPRVNPKLVCENGHAMRKPAVKGT